MILSGKKELYEELWETGTFRKDKNRSNTHLDLFLAVSKSSNPNPSIIDWGCGRGTKTAVLEDKGFKVVGCNDIAHNALDDEMKARFPFFQAQPLHLASPQSATFSFCVDVMEHLPEEEIIPALINIRKYTSNHVFFAIDCAEDDWGEHQLHVTIQPPEYWFGLMLEYFGPATFLYTLPIRPTIGGLWTS